MSDIKKVDLLSVASISCMRCKEAYPIDSIEYMCFTDGNCQKCRAELSGKFADGKSLMKLKRPIKIDTQWTHKKQGMVCEVSEIWINTAGQAVIESIDENNELSTDSVSSFINNYRKG